MTSVEYKLKKGKFDTNRLEELKQTMLCFYLLQLNMVYINSVMLQQIFKEPNWLVRISIEEKKASTPLLHEYINTYGFFVFDLNSRLTIKHPDLKEAAASYA